MSFFDDASLAFLPSGGAGKDTKAYSIKPTDGSGDFTFSRGSNLAATRVGPTGLIEKGRENLLLQSNQFDTTWSKTLSSVIGNQSGYNGSNDAWKMISGASGTYSIVSQNYSGSGVHTLSLYAKAAEWNYIALFINGSAGASKGAIFDLTTGELTNTIFGSPISYSSNSIGDGWWRLSVTLTGTITGANIYLCEVGTSHTSNNNDGSSGIYIQDAQLEIGLAATDYIESGATTGKAGLLEDEPRFDYSGGATCPSLLLEGSRTNLVSQSEYFGDTQWSINNASLDANNTTSVEGLQNAYKITDDSNTGYHKVSYLNAFVSDGVMRTWSVFVKQGNARYCAITHASVFSSAVNSLIFDMQEGVYTNEGTTQYFDIVHEPIDMGNGWWRIGFSSDINSTSYDNFSIGISQGASWTNNLSYTGDGSLDFYIYGAQTEAGSYPTSYIPNHSGTGSVTRGADLTTADTSSFYTDSLRGTLFTELSFPLAADGNYNGWFFWNGSGYHRIVLQRRGDTGRGQIEVRINNTTQASVISPSVITLEDNHKMLVRWDGNVFTLFIDGVNIGSDTSTDTYSGTDLNELASRPTYNAANIKQALLFPTALTDSECIKLTTL